MSRGSSARKMRSDYSSFSHRESLSHHCRTHPSLRGDDNGDGTVVVLPKELQELGDLGVSTRLGNIIFDILAIYESKNDVGGNTALFLMTNHRGHHGSMTKLTKMQELIEEWKVLSKKNQFMTVVEEKKIKFIKLGLGMKGGDERQVLSEEDSDLDQDGILEFTQDQVHDLDRPTQ